jgi:AcrR family transcriptional regulator
MNDTRDRLVNVGAELFSRQGLTGTGIKQVLNGAHAPFSSLYHHFPGGKNELAAEVIRTSGARYQELVEGVWDEQPDVISAVAAVFEGAAGTLEATEFAVACPIATVALEVATTNEDLRMATAEVFESWLESGTKRLTTAGIDPSEAHSVACVLVALLEGAFILSQSSRSTAPMKAAGAAAVEVVRRAVTTGTPRRALSARP